MPVEKTTKSKGNGARRRTLAVGAVLMLLSGCASASRLYQGEPKPTTEIATLTVERPFTIAGANIAVDEGQQGAGSYEMLPGSYEVELHFTVAYTETRELRSSSGGGWSGAATIRRSEVRPCAITFEAQAGKTYRVMVNTLPAKETITGGGSIRSVIRKPVYAARMLDGELNDEVGEACQTEAASQ